MLLWRWLGCEAVLLGTVHVGIYSKVEISMGSVGCCTVRTPVYAGDKECKMLCKFNVDD